MITAKQFLKRLDEEKGTIWTEDICAAFIEFGKLCAREALEYAAHRAEAYTDFIHGEELAFVKKESILNAYPLTNIK